MLDDPLNGVRIVGYKHDEVVPRLLLSDGRWIQPRVWDVDDVSFQICIQAGDGTGHRLLGEEDQF